MSRNRKKHGVAVSGAWLPLSLAFLRSRAAAELSPHGAKLLIDVLAMLGPNASRNGDISLAPKLLRARGWPSSATLVAAVGELIDCGLLVKTRQGSRLDCSLFAVTLYPLDCDPNKIDVGPGSYALTDWTGDGALAGEPSEAEPARWRRARKAKRVVPPRNEVPPKRSATERSSAVAA